MPRLVDSRSWDLLREVPDEHFRLVKEVLSLRQKITLARETCHFLRRCIKHHVIPPFIRRRRVLDELRIHPEDRPRLEEMEMRLLRTALRHKNSTMHTFMRRCDMLEADCSRCLEPSVWQRIMDGSSFICSSLGIDTKETLDRKFAEMFNELRALRRPISPFRRPVSPTRWPTSPSRRPAPPSRRPASPLRRPVSPARRPITPECEPLYY
ncbi:hypothetical protein KIN20_001229 [Parelaphostrongylus tenuis]|uniref:Uncharacterized protein n=1 Tax=Parelaphostrongylus tenuis TaxID=148309 RepID=A0AAD5QEE2_PARTN|nr:hypothetical protein KIN20_001229 [Parelaphostrongylus tenuis]